MGNRFYSRSNSPECATKNVARVLNHPIPEMVVDNARKLVEKIHSELLGFRLLRRLIFRLPLELEFCAVATRLLHNHASVAQNYTPIKTKTLTGIKVCGVFRGFSCFQLAGGGSSPETSTPPVKTILTVKVIKVATTRQLTDMINPNLPLNQKQNPYKKKSKRKSNNKNT